MSAKNLFVTVFAKFKSLQSVEERQKFLVNLYVKQLTFKKFLTQNSEAIEAEISLGLSLQDAIENSAKINFAKFILELFDLKLNEDSTIVEDENSKVFDLYMNKTFGGVSFTELTTLINQDKKLFDLIK